MTKHQIELIRIVDQLRELLQQANKVDAEKILGEILEKAQEIGKAWSGSYLGYHAYLYCRTLTAPASGAWSNPEWGLMKGYGARETRGEWVEFAKDEIRHEIERRTGQGDLDSIRENSAKARDRFEHYKSESLSILSSLIGEDDTFVSSIKENIEKLDPWTKSDFVRNIQTPATMTRDTRAVSPRYKTATSHVNYV